MNIINMKFSQFEKAIDDLSLQTWDFDLGSIQSIVYFLLKDDICVYVGISRNTRIFSRIATHIRGKKNGEKDFNRIVYLSVKDHEKAWQVEYFFITTLMPKYNDLHNYRSPTPGDFISEMYKKSDTKALMEGSRLICVIKDNLPKVHKRRERLTKEQVKRFKIQIDRGIRISDLSETYNVSIMNLYKIKRCTHYLQVKPIKLQENTTK